MEEKQDDDEEKKVVEDGKKKGIVKIIKREWVLTKVKLLTKIPPQCFAC